MRRSGGGRPSVSRIGRDRNGSIGAPRGQTPSSSPARISRSARTSRASMAPRMRRRGWVAPPVRTVSPASSRSSRSAKPRGVDRRQGVALVDQRRRAGRPSPRRRRRPRGRRPPSAIGLQRLDADRRARAAAGLAVGVEQGRQRRPGAADRRRARRRPRPASSPALRAGGPRSRPRLRGRGPRRPWRSSGAPARRQVLGVEAQPRAAGA